MENKFVYVSVTGLRLKSWRSFLPFCWHAARSMAQARAAEGNIRTEARKIAGVHHTLSVWASEASMRAFMVKGDHLQAMKAFRRIATGKTFGFETSEVPQWHEVHQLWLERGVER